MRLKREKTSRGFSSLLGFFQDHSGRKTFAIWYLPQPITLFQNIARQQQQQQQQQHCIIKAIFNEMLKEIRHCLGFTYHLFCNWSRKLTNSLNQSKAKLKTIVTWLFASSLASSCLLICNLNPHWLMMM